MRVADFSIRASDLGVRYSLRYTKKTTLRRTFRGLLRRDGRPQQFWALRHVSFELGHGESLGVIGPNGAGKSTLLQVLAGIIQPSEGVVEVHGHVSTLLHLQAGFDQDLTGRDNIMMAGALMGMDLDLMEERQEEIIRFADIGGFIDQPLKTYSSGMRAKLGFSIATAVDPDILLLDEVLQTGDEVFRAKSRARIEEILAAAKAVVLVSHDMTWVQDFCTRAILLERGHIVADGEPRGVIAQHLERSERRKQERAAEVARILADEAASPATDRRGRRRRDRSAAM